MRFENTKKNLHKWGLTKDADCKCGSVQTLKHLLECPMDPLRGEREDFLETHWSNDAITIADLCRRKKFKI